MWELGKVVLETAESASVLDSEVVTFIVDAAQKVLGIMTTPPLGTFLTIGIIGAVVGLVGGIVRMVRRGHE